MDIPSQDGFDIAGLVHHIITSVQQDPSNWRELLPHARSLTAFLDISASGFRDFTGEQRLWVIDTLQKLAFAEPDTGAISDIANWCLRQALVIIDESPEDTVALRLIAENWLLRAQPNLAQINLLDPSSSSSEGHGSPSQIRARTSQDESRTSNGAASAERLYTADYVEARGLLLPATEYFSRTIEASENQGKLTGELLARAAEAYMSLGNVSSIRTNSQYFRQAIQYLRKAAQLPDYSLSPHLEQYLDDYEYLLE